MIALLAAHGQTESFHRYSGEFAERDGVRVSVSVEANVYTWLVENVDAAPITMFEMPQRNCYNQRMPIGWASEYEDNYFRAWTDESDAAIGPGEIGEFTTRVSSTGAVLGHVPLTLSSAGGAQSIVVDHLWGPVRKSRRLVVMVALLVAGIAVFHTILLKWLSKRQRAHALQAE